MTKQPAIHYLVKRSLLFIGVILGLTFLLDFVGNNLVGMVLEGWPTDTTMIGLGYTFACFLLGTTLTRESQLTLTQFNYSRQTQFRLILSTLVGTILILSVFKVGYISLGKGLSLVKFPMLIYFSLTPVLNLLGNVGAQFVTSLLLVFLGWFYILLKQYSQSKWLPLVMTAVATLSPVLLLLSTIIFPVEQRIRLIDFGKEPVVLLLLSSFGLLILGSLNYRLFKKSAYN